MNPEKLFGVPKNVAHSIIITIAGLCVTLLMDLFFQTVSRPYWIDSDDSPAAGDRFHTITVVNPGPWSTRFPTIEFLKPLKIEFVNWSPGVTWDTNARPNVVSVAAEKGVPAGANFFITYKYSSTNLDRGPKVLCDGKECKYAPTIDVDNMLKILLISQGVLVILVIGAGVLYVRADRLLFAEKANPVNQALAIIAKQKGEQDVSESVRAVEAMELPLEARPQSVKPPKNSKK